MELFFNEELTGKNGKLQGNKVIDLENGKDVILTLDPTIQNRAEAALQDLIKKNFDFKPKAIIEKLNLRQPIYQKTAAYGHFGREEEGFGWENTDKVDELKRVLR